MTKCWLIYGHQPLTLGSHSVPSPLSSDLRQQRLLLALSSTAAPSAARRLSGPAEPKGPSALPGKRISALLSGHAPASAGVGLRPGASEQGAGAGALHPAQHPAGTAHLRPCRASPRASTRRKADGVGCERRNVSLKLSACSLFPAA